MTEQIEETPELEIEPNLFRGTKEYRQKMHSINSQVQEIMGWLNQYGVQPQANTNARLEKFMLALMDAGIVSEEFLSDFNISFAEGFLSDLKEVRKQVSTQITRQTLLQGVQGVDPSKLIRPGG